jgi:hypothetical protein
MAERRLRIWYDAEGDYLEVIFDQRPGYFRETRDDRVMEKVDAEGNIQRLLGAARERAQGEAAGGRALTARWWRHP